MVMLLNDTATTEIYTLSLHDALPSSVEIRMSDASRAKRWAHRSGLFKWPLREKLGMSRCRIALSRAAPIAPQVLERSEEHTAELQSRHYRVCRLLLEKKRVAHAANLR